MGARVDKVDFGERATVSRVKAYNQADRITSFGSLPCRAACGDLRRENGGLPFSPRPANQFFDALRWDAEALQGEVLFGNRMRPCGFSLRPKISLRILGILPRIYSWSSPPHDIDGKRA